MSILSEDLQELIRRLSVSAENCTDIAVDLRTIKFESTDDEMFLVDASIGEPLKIKFSKDDPNDATTTHAQRQFCKVIGVPFKFFMENRPIDRNRIVKSWISSLAPAEGDETVRVVKVREGGIIKVVRAVLPVSYTTMFNSEIVELLTNSEDPNLKVDLDWCSGDSRDDLLFHARIIYGEPLAGDYRVGVSLLTSELGASDLVIDSFLYHEPSKTYMMANYGKEPFAKLQYGKVQPTEITKVLSTISSRVLEEATRYLDTAMQYSESYPGVEKACAILVARKGMPTKFKRPMYLEAEGAHDDMGTLLDFTRHAGLVANDMDLASRMKIERALGAFAGLTFEKR